jgi:hypothetical protein
MRATGSRPLRSHTLWLAAPVALIVLVMGMIPMFGGMKPPPSVAHECWVASGPDRYRVLDMVDNLETCGARLEFIFLSEGKPAQGLYSGVSVFADARGVDAAPPHGPRTTLLGARTRRDLDAAIRTLVARGPEAPGR